MRYVVEVGNGNASLLALQDDGTYKKLAYAAGEDKTADLVNLANEANTFWEDED